MSSVSPEKKKSSRSVLLPVFLLTAAFSLAAGLFLRFLGPLIRLFEGKGGKLGPVFGQLKTARILPPVLLCFVLWLLFYLLPLDKLKKRTAVFLKILFGLLLFFGCLFLTRVNGILFGRVVFSLLKSISNGLLNKL